MSSVIFTVTGDPKAQPRPRAFAMKLRNGKYSARVFEAGTAEHWKGMIAGTARNYRLAAEIAGPVRVNATFIFDRPAKHFVANDRGRPLRADAPTWHTGKPDRDNLEKSLLDALTQIGGFWHDDSQVCAGEVRKIYGPTPGVIVEIAAVDVEVAT